MGAWVSSSWWVATRGGEAFPMASIYFFIYLFTAFACFSFSRVFSTPLCASPRRGCPLLGCLPHGSSEGAAGAGWVRDGGSGQQGKQELPAKAQV